MNILAIETSGGRGSVAVVHNKVTIQRFCDSEKADADELLPLIDRLLHELSLQLHDMDGFACGRGPGAFTGVRIATAVAQGLAYSMNKPLATVSTLAAVAQSVQTSGPVLVCTDARKGQVYCGLFRRDATGLMQLDGEEKVIDPADVPDAGPEAQGAGSGFSVCGELESRVGTVCPDRNPEAQWIAQCALLQPDSFRSVFDARPVYVRDNVTHGE